MKLYYKNSGGEIIDFMDDKITATKPESLLTNKWSYNSSICINDVKIKNFYKETVERSLELEIFADDRADFNKIMERLIKVCEYDVRRNQPGRIYWNDFYKECFIIGSSPSDFDENFETVIQNITVLSGYDHWIRETEINYLKSSTEDDESGFEYPYDYGELDYMKSDYVEVVKNFGIYSANFIIKFFGPCTNPSVIINGNEYSLVDIELEEGEYAEINSKTRKIKKVYADGEEENIFHLRSSNDIFELIAAGTVSIIRARNMQVTITLFDERGEPIWI